MTRTDSAWLNFSGQVCVVTGSAGGIGRAIAMSFARAGAKVATLDFNLEGCQETMAMIRALGGSGIAVKCDVSDEASVAAAAQQVQSSLGECDVLVNNAGVIGYGRLESVPMLDWDRLMRVNLNGYLHCSQQFGRQMLARRRGVIVHVASIAATEPHSFCSAYSVSKAAVVMLSSQMALEWGPRGVRVNSVSPGFVRTPLSKEFYSQKGVSEQRTALVPMRRIGTPQDMADAVLFMASERASYIAGHNLIIDGGLSQASMSQIKRPGYDDSPA